ncbi:hypothetical protein [Echinicola rosea]|uniref:Uncharacterized protein n=1 Tax=Echinicola rosea TaxID=1807691 RepID=A0ABQ1UUU9_9BACT|nr:hypothetical protein [Echinicola rosea]GGF26746.1 hypothetical protein GCM10011339_13580 [Echinicola rosea]
MIKVNAFFITLLLAIVSVKGFGQEFHPSEEFLMTTVPDSLRSIDALYSSPNDRTNIYLTDKKGNVLKEFSVFIESYYDDSKVEEMAVPHLKHVRKVIRLSISHCPCYCDIDVHYWLLTHDGKWVALPVLTPPDYEASLTYLAYIFPEEKPNLIELHEYQDEVILGDGEPRFNQIADRTIKTLFWNGMTIEEN